MHQLNNYIVKIVSDLGSATGFVHLLSEESDYVHIFTARHVVINADAALPSGNPIQIDFFDADSSKYTLQKDDQILYGSDNDKEDIAIIIIKKNVIPATVEISNSPRLSMLSGKEKDCFIIGVPKAVQNKVPRTLNEAVILADKDFPNQIQISVADPVTTLYNSDDLIEGYSGSPIFIMSAGQYYACGVVSKYEENTKRILAIDFVLAQQIIAKADLPELSLMEVETDLDVIEDINKIKSNTQRVLNRIKDRIGSITLERTQLAHDLKNKILGNSVVLISGRAGVGKSALVKHALSGMQEEFELIALQGEQLDKTNIGEIFSAGPLQLSNSFETILNSTGIKSKKVLLIDSVEKILETSNADTIIDFFSLLKTITDFKIIFTCRSYAVEQFKIRFLQQFPEFLPFEIPLLNDDELKVVCATYPAINRLLEKQSLKRILQIPFNLDKATLITNEAFDVDIKSEADFKKIMWEYVIENKQNEANPEIREKRGTIFSEIALTRARLMVPYVRMNTDVNILHELSSDNIIEPNPLLANQFAAAHDIYEDWALTKYIEEKYQDFILVNLDVETLFLNIGYAPAIRRAFRIWISEKLENIDYNIKELLNNILKNAALQQYWKDEVMIAIMQSPYSATFLNDNKELLISSDFNLFKRSILLLKVACQRPDFSYLGSFKEGQKSQIYRSAYLKPFGEGWSNMVNFVFSNIHELRSQYPLIIPFLLQWEKGIGVWGGLPDESRNAGLIILDYLKYSPETDDDEDSDYHQSNIKECIQLLFKLTRVLPNEVKDVLEEVLKFDRKARNSGNAYSEKAVPEVLSWLNSVEICRIHPDMVLKIAEKEWFYYQPSQEEIEKMLEGSPFKSIPRGIEKEEEFGVTGRSTRIYPASPYQTPITHLLGSSPEKTLEFIARLFNHSLEAFLKSNFLAEDSIVWKKDPRTEIKIELPDGRITVQYGTLALWLMYRGSHIATPYLLQSLLMGLEQWLMQLAAFANDKDRTAKNPAIKQKLEYAFDYLLSESKNVATTSVLVSVATAYPELLAGKILPLLKIKEFYKWDLMRCHYERDVLTPLGSSPLSEFMQKERYNSKQLPHRNEHLETLFLKLSFGTHVNELLGILDNFYSVTAQEDDWRFALNRMDRRKLEIISEVDNGFMVQIKLDEDLQPKADESKKILDSIIPLSQASNWGLKKMKNEPVEEDSLENWRKHFANLVSHGALTKQEKLYYQPAVIAAVGIRDYFEELNEEELTWCIDKVFAVVEYEIKRSFNPYDMGLDSPFGAFESQPAFVTLVELVSKCTNANQAKAKELLFASLIFIHNELDRKEIVKKIRNNLWSTSPDFALACVVGMIRYSKISDLRMRIAHFHPEPGVQFSDASKVRFNLIKWIAAFIKKLFSKKKSDNKKLSQKEASLLKEQWIQEYENTLDIIIADVIKNNHSFSFNDFQSKDHSPYLLIEALRLIPHDTANEDLQKYCSLITSYVLNNLEAEGRFNDDKIPYQLLQSFQKYTAIFLLKQPKEVSFTKFKELCDPIFDSLKLKGRYNRKRIDFLDRLLEELITQVATDNSLSPNFWQLWEYMVLKIESTGVSYFSAKILLDYLYWDSETRDWQPMKGKKHFFEQAIQNFNELKSSARLLSGIGFTELLPEGLLWISKLLESNELEEEYAVFYTEKLVINIFYDKQLRTTVRTNATLRENFIKILDKLIDQSSSSAFLIREDFISLN